MSNALETAEQTLEARLDALGFPADPETLDARSLEFLAIRTGNHHDLLHPLARRGWVDWFDLEGDFDRPGAHAHKVSELLGRSGVHQAVVRDEWLEGVGWLLEVDVGGTSAWFFQPSDEDQPSDWGEVGLFVLPVRHFAPDVRVESVLTFDQSCCIVCIPQVVFDTLERDGLLRVSDEESQFERGSEPPADDPHVGIDWPDQYGVLLHTRLVSAEDARALRDGAR